MDWGKTLALGSLHLPISLVAFVPALLLGGFFLKRHFRDQELFKAVESALFWGLFGAFALWKLSPILYLWDTLLSAPFSWLYIPGNLWGVVLGILWFIGVQFFFFRTHWSQRADIFRGIQWWLGTGMGTFLLLWSALSWLPLGSAPVVEPAAKVTQMELSTLEGSKLTLESFKGRTVIVNFWATWCQPCLAELPLLKKFAQAHEAQGVVVLGVNLTSTEKSPGGVRGFAEAAGLNFPIVLDSDGKMALSFGVVSVPSTWVLSPEGRWKARKTGTLSPEDLESFLRP